MGQVLFAYLIAILLIVNSVNSSIPALQVLDLVAGVYFAVVGSIAGWIAARD